MSLNGLLRQSITIKNPSGDPDLHGKESFGSAATVRCRFERTYKTIVTAQREREPVHGVAVVPPATVVSRGAQVQFGSDKYRVLQRSDAPGRNGQLHHIELLLQEWSFAS